MHFTKVQISELMRKHTEKENGLHDLMEIMLESMMIAGWGEFLRESPDNQGKWLSFEPYLMKNRSNTDGQCRHGTEGL